MIIKYQSIFLLDEGIDTRIHGIKLISESEKEPGLNQDLFTPTELIRYVMRAVISAIFFFKWIFPHKNDWERGTHHWGGT